MAQKDIDFSVIKTMSAEQQQQAYYTLAKRANQRMRDFERKDLTSHASKKAQKYLTEVYDRQTFIQSKKISGVDLKEGLKALEDFFTAKTATAKGIKEIEKTHLKRFRESGINLESKSDRKNFFEFLNSGFFKSLSRYADSKQVADDFGKAIDEGFTVEQILAGYDEFIENDITFEEVAERRANISTALLH